MTRTYLRKPTNLVMDNQGKRYLLKVRDLPLEDKPRERLVKYGPENLTSKELLAVVLNVGSKKEDVLEMSSRVMTEYGEKSFANQRDVKVLSEQSSLPLNKAAQIVACVELGRRFFKNNGTESVMIRTAKDVFSYTKDMSNLSKEYLRGLYLNSQYRIIHDEIISIGTLDASIIHPREVFKPALAYSAAALVLVHNHPSGIVDPSQSDIDITRQLSEVGRILGIELIDHVIVTRDSFVSIPTGKTEVMSNLNFDEIKI